MDGDPVACYGYDDYHCTRCDRDFKSRTAALQHVLNSGRHHLCNIGTCKWDADGRDAILDHWRRRGCRTVCEGCLKGIMPHYYLQHLEDEHVCRACGKHNESTSNLEHHKLVHLPASLECWGCYRKFARLPDMMIHLQRGSCSSGINELDLNESAAMCFQWKYFVHENWRGELLQREDLDEFNAPFPFFCPGCGTNFRDISGLFQHVASPSCDETLDSFAMAKLIHWLKNRHA